MVLRDRLKVKMKIASCSKKTVLNFWDQLSYPVQNIVCDGQFSIVLKQMDMERLRL